MSNSKKDRLKRIRRMPPKLILKKGVRKIQQKNLHSILRAHDQWFDTRKNRSSLLSLEPIPFTTEDLNFHDITPERALKFWKHYKRHEFNILGSGWVDCGYVDNALGFEGSRYPGLVLHTDAEGEFLKALLPSCCIKKSQRLWRMIKGTYQGIDWQKDYKSGYRWNNRDWYVPLKLSGQPGGDVKIPWEIGRLQHLPRFALFYYVLPGYRAEIFTEYCNQLLDFFAQNPVRWGVQSMCPMDMGIRAANIALSYSLFKAQGVPFSKEFTNAVAENLYEVCHHIYHNLEWSDEFTNNHYLADLAGLLYGSTVLAGCRQSQKWQRLAAEELQKEFVKQFHEEGTNREGSSFYHRLSSEIIAWSFALLLKLKMITRIDGKRLYGALQFLQKLTRPDGLLTAVGDNDSGFFFHLSFTGKGTIEEPNDAHPTMAALTAFFKENAVLGNGKMEYSIIRGLLPLQWKLPFCSEVHLSGIKKKDCSTQNLQYENRKIIVTKNSDLTEAIQAEAFPQFGVYIIKSKGLYLCLSLADNGQGGNGGHAHNDKLSIELFVDGKVVYEDPGTYVYTASESLRNQYRSVKAHHTIYTGMEQNEFLGMFSMENEAKCEIYNFSAEHILAEVRYKDVIHRREIFVRNNKAEIIDACNKKFNYVDHNTKVCHGYGNVKL